MREFIAITLLAVAIDVSHADELKLEVPLTPENQELIVPQMCDSLIAANFEKWGSLCRNLVPALAVQKALREKSKEEPKESK